MTDDPDALVGQVVAALQRDGVYVSPELSAKVSAEQLASIRESVASAEQPVFVVAYPLTSTDPFGGKAADLLVRVHAALGEDGAYLATTQRYEPTQYSDVSLEARSWGDGFRSEHQAVYVAGQEHPRDLGAQLVRATELLAGDPATQQKAYDEVSESTASSSGQEHRESGLPEWVEPTAWTGGVLLGLVAVGVGLARLGRRRAERDRTLPAAVIDRVRRARDAELRKRADADVLELAERIAGATAAGERGTASLQAALDHQEEARRLLERVDARGAREEARDALDVVGAVVLAERGLAAVTAAEAGQEYRPAGVCFLNPLHGAATRDEVVEYAAARAAVPLCAECARQMSRSTPQPDVLDVMVGGSPVHYFESGIEPWASTGFGALQADLIERLRTRE